MMKLKYELETMKFADLKGNIEIPKFQRGLVWGKQKKHDFIKSLKAGLPIGVLLVAPKGDKYQIIDGLQRFTTMLDYSKNFFNYIDREEITDYHLMSIIVSSPDARRIFDDYSDTVKQIQFDEMRNILISKITEGYAQNKFQISQASADELCKKIAALPEKDAWSIALAVFNVIEAIFNNSQIDDIELPLIIFTGPSEDLASIFQKLNQEGVKLSKYDVFAATWINSFVKIENDPPFIEFIINKYEAAQRDSDLEIADYDPDEMKQSGQLTVFEYAFAVGKALMDKCARLFPKKDAAKVDSIGFLLLAELMGLTYQNMGALADTIKSYPTLNYKKLKDAIVEAGTIVESALTPYIDAPTIPKRGQRTSLVCHSELQLASFIIVVFKLKYQLTPEDGLVPIHSRDLARVKQFMHKHYLYDILRGHWSGSGDSKLEEIIAQPTTCRYTKDVAKDHFEMAVSKWLDDGNQKAKLTNVSVETKLFLNYLLRTSGNYSDRISYDIEHCVPKDVLTKYYIRQGITVPISAPCNLVFIPTSDNRSKGELTYYQRQANDPGTFTLNQAQLDNYGYPTKGELAFTEATSTLTSDNYFKYLDNRKKVLLHKFISALYD